MDEFEDDPLDLLDDDDGVLETILLFDENEKKPAQARTGCAVLLFGIGSLAGAGWWIIAGLRA